jgi:hypothetical protein
MPLLFPSIKAAASSIRTPTIITTAPKWLRDRVLLTSSVPREAPGMAVRLTATRRAETRCWDMPCLDLTNVDLTRRMPTPAPTRTGRRWHAVYMLFHEASRCRRSSLRAQQHAVPQKRVVTAMLDVRLTYAHSRAAHCASRAATEHKPRARP